MKEATSIVSIQRTDKTITYAFISFFATLRNDTVPQLSVSGVSNSLIASRKVVAFSRISVSG
jgi:hypothetical protein